MTRQPPNVPRVIVVQEMVLADFLLADGDPLANVNLFDDLAKNFVVIQKNGKIYKNCQK